MTRFLLLLLFLLPSVSFPADYTVTLDAVRFSDLARVVYGDILKQSYVLDRELVDAPDTVSVNWIKLTKSQVDGLMLDLSKNRGFAISERHGALFIQKQTVSSDDEILIYRPLFRSSRYLSDIVSSVTNARLMTRRAVSNSLNQGDLQSTGQDTSSPTSANALLDRATADQIVLNVAREDMAKVKKLLADLDTPTGEIVLKAAVYEVGTTQAEGGAVQVVANLLKGRFNASVGSTLAGGNTLSFVGGGLDVVLAALDQDSRFKTISRPMVRVRSGAQARFSVGQDVPVLGQATLDKNGNPVQSVDYRQSGVILTVTPDIHESIIDLDISQELSSFVATTTGVNNSPTLLKRTVNSKLSIRSGEVVIFAGLNEKKTDQTESRFFGFNIGKQSSQGDTEILVFVEAQRI